MHSGIAGSDIIAVYEKVKSYIISAHCQKPVARLIRAIVVFSKAADHIRFD